MPSQRSPEQIRRILRAIQAKTALPDHLSDQERRQFERAAAQIEEKTVRSLSAVKRYKTLTIARPFRWIQYCVLAILTVSALGIAALGVLGGEGATASIYGPIATVGALAVASLGWGIGSWVTMRNARIQHTINIIFARFPHATFGDNQSAFFAQFGAGVQQRVSTQAVKALEGQTPPNKGLLGLRYLLNYYEFIAVGILRGDLDFDIINQTLRTPMAYLYDKCEPYIVDMQRDSPTLLENYAAVRDALREP